MALASISSGLADVMQHELTALGVTAVQLGAVPKYLYTLWVDNSLNALPTFLKLYDSAGAINPAADIPDMVLKIPAGRSGDILVEHIQMLNSSAVSFVNGLSVAASAGKTIAGAAPASAFNCKIGLL